MSENGCNGFRDNYNIGYNKKDKERERLMEGWEKRLEIWKEWSGGEDMRMNDWREDDEGKVYYFNVFRKWGCLDWGIDEDGNELKEFYRMFEVVEIIERRKELREVFEEFRKCMNWKGELNKEKVIKEFDKFMKFRERMWRDDWEFKFKDEDDKGMLRYW